MAQVIDLLSSSPVYRGNGATDNKQPANHTASSVILSGVWEDEEFEPGPKRRRLSSISDPSSFSNPVGTTQQGRSTFLDILDEPWSDTYKDTTDHSARAKSSKKETVGNGLWDDLDDPILCSSSPWLSQKHHTVQERCYSDVITVDDDGDHQIQEDDEPFDFSQELPSTSFVSDKTAKLLAKIKNQSKPSSVLRPSGSRKNTSTQDIISSDGIEKPVASRRKTSRVKINTADKSAERAAKDLERGAAKARRDQEREEKQEQKRKLKEEKEKQKAIAAGIAEANKSKLDKKLSLLEMIIDMAASFEGTRIGAQVTEYMKKFDVEVNFVPTQIPKVVSWRRKVTAEYDREASHWKPCALTIKKEAHVLCYLSAQEFVDLVFSANGEDLDSHVRNLRRCYPRYKPIYLIEGLTALMRKGRNERNSKYQTAVRRLGENEPSTGTAQSSQPKRGRKSRAEPRGPIDEDAIEDALLQLQVYHSCLVYQTSTPPDSAEWIKVYTENISTIPYRQEMMNLYDASFCMDVGQVKAGIDADDTYAKMLQEITRVTAPIAYGVANRYGSVSQLVQAFKSGGPLLLGDVKKCANKSGAVTESRIGPAVSRRLYNIFTSLDPTSTDI